MLLPRGPKPFDLSVRDFQDFTEFRVLHRIYDFPVISMDFTYL